VAPHRRLAHFPGAAIAAAVLPRRRQNLRNQENEACTSGK
jgi:hypothetical protein